MPPEKLTHKKKKKTGRRNRESKRKQKENRKRKKRKRDRNRQRQKQRKKGKKEKTWKIDLGGISTQTSKGTFLNDVTQTSVFSNEVPPPVTHTTLKYLSLVTDLFYLLIFISPTFPSHVRIS